MADSAPGTQLAPTVQTLPARRTGRYGPFARWLFRRVFDAVQFPVDAVPPLRKLAQEATLVYVLRSSSLLHLIYFNWTFWKLRLPLARAATGLGYRIFGPFARWYLGGSQIRARKGGEVAHVLESVRRGEAVMVFLRAPRTLPSAVTTLPDPFPALVELQRAQARPIALVPLTFLWRQRPKKLGGSWRDAFLGDPDEPGAIRTFLGYLFNRKSSYLKVGEAVSLADVNPMNAGPAAGRRAPAPRARDRGGDRPAAQVRGPGRRRDAAGPAAPADAGGDRPRARPPGRKRGERGAQGPARDRRPLQPLRRRRPQAPAQLRLPPHLRRRGRGRGGDEAPGRGQQEGSAHPLPVPQVAHRLHDPLDDLRRLRAAAAARGGGRQPQLLAGGKTAARRRGVLHPAQLQGRPDLLGHHGRLREAAPPGRVHAGVLHRGWALQDGEAACAEVRHADAGGRSLADRRQARGVLRASQPLLREDRRGPQLSARAPGRREAEGEREGAPLRHQGPAPQVRSHHHPSRRAHLARAAVPRARGRPEDLHAGGEEEDRAAPRLEDRRGHQCGAPARPHRPRRRRAPQPRPAGAERDGDPRSRRVPAHGRAGQRRAGRRGADPAAGSERRGVALRRRHGQAARGRRGARV